jgi:dipeptidyl aminopeptidase/acylaminoacyl peptidase
MKKTIILTSGLLTLVAILYVALSFYITSLAFQAKRNMPEETPLDYSLKFENVSFKSEDPEDILLEGWWIPSKKNKGTIIWVHGLDSERSGGEGKLEMLMDINNLGFSILTFDLRGHGNSSTAPLGLGVKEKNDVYGAINFLKEEKGINRVGLWGISYGGVTVIDSAINNPSNTIVGVIADTPYYSVLELLTKEVSDRTPIPKFIAELLKFGIVKSGEFMYGMNINEVSDSMDKNYQLKFPLMIFSCITDQRVPPNHPDRIFSKSNRAAKYYKFEFCEDHGEAYEGNKVEYMKLFNTYFSERFAE